MCNAQPPISETYNNLADEEWLPRQSIRTLFQDSKANLWVGTNEGLFKYNLYEAVNYNLTKAGSRRLLNNTIWCINEDANGNILVGTESGLGVLNPVTGAFQVVTKNDHSIIAISRGMNGVCWFVASDNKIYRLRTPSLEKAPQPELFVRGQDSWSTKTIKAVCEMPDGNLLIGTSYGLFSVNPEHGKLLATSFQKPVTCLYGTDYNGFWVGTASEGLFKLKLSSARVEVQQHLPTGSAQNPVNNYITAIHAQLDGSLLITTPLQVFSGTSKSNSLRPLTPDNAFNDASIMSLCTDRTSTIWVGSKKGLYRMPVRDLELEYLQVLSHQYSQDNLVNNLFRPSEDFLWLLTSNYGLHRVNIKTGAQQKVDLPFVNFRCAKRAGNGDLLLVADSVVLEIHGDAANSQHPSYRVLARGRDWLRVNDMVEVFPGEWWATSWNKGLMRISTRAGVPSRVYEQAKKQFSEKSHLFSIAKDADDQVWIGTRGEGVVRVNLATGEAEHLAKESARHKTATRILFVKVDSRNRVWVGTRGDGLQLYRPATGDFRVYNEKDGLPSNTICALAESSTGDIWVATLNGVARMTEQQLIKFYAYGFEDGISNTEFSFQVAAPGREGSVYFGNGAGIYRIKLLEQNRRDILPVVWTDFEVLKETRSFEGIRGTDSLANTLVQQLNQDKEIVLSHHQNNIRIGFSSMDFSLPQKNRYLYRLRGLDSSWKLVQGVRQSVQYIDLSPGKYVFEVKSSNNRGEWPDEAQSFTIVIKPSFWTTTYAYTLYILVIVALLVVGVLLRRRWHRLNNRLEQEIESGKLYNRQMVFYTDLSHEIRNRLSLLLGPLEHALSGKKVNPQMLQSLYEQGLRLKRLTDKIMYIRKSESGGFILNVAEENIGGRIRQIVAEAEPLALVKNIRLSYIEQKEGISGWCDEELLEIMAMNLLNNAIKYCKAGGSVTITTDNLYLGGADLPAPGLKEGNYLFCSITDTGVGIAAEEITRIGEPFYRASNVRGVKKETTGTGIGLDLVGRLIQKHYGCWEIHSAVNEYTTVSFYLPIDKGAFSINELKPNMVHAPIIMGAGHPVVPAAVPLITPEISAPPPQGPAGFKKGSSILLVDDSEEILNLVAGALEGELSVLRARNGVEALAVLQNQEVQLIVSDLDMPEMDGLTLCCNVRRMDKSRNVPFLILTGRNSEEQKLVCIQNGVDDFIEKPFSLELLRWRIKSFLRSSLAPVKLKTVMVVEPVSTVPESVEDQFIQSIINLIDSHLDKDYLDVDFLAENLFTSRATFYRRMEQLVGESPSVFIRKYRLKKAALFLKHGLDINAAAAKTGFSSVKYFSRCFQKEYGMTPAQFTGQKAGS